LTLEGEFEALFQAHQREITGYLCKLLGDAERGQELAQETFLRAYRALARGTQVEHPRAWLYRIATNAAHDHFRRARLVRWVPLLDGERDAALRQPDPAEAVADRLAVQAALTRLQPKYRIPLLLHLAEGLSTAEIGEVLKISRDAVKMRLYRGREQFRRAFRAAGGLESEEIEP
jgi:RNA polymerase sigma-70 factor (ECF subfamily)